MERLLVSSTTVASIGYDPATEVLEVEFHKTGLYQYFNVPDFVYEEMMAAPSQGTYLNTNIKGRYQYERL